MGSGECPTPTPPPRAGTKVLADYIALPRLVHPSLESPDTAQALSLISYSVCTPCDIAITTQMVPLWGSGLKSESVDQGRGGLLVRLAGARGWWTAEATGS